MRRGASLIAPLFFIEYGKEGVAERKIFGMGFLLDRKKGKFKQHPGEVVGQVDEDGNIENTDYQFKRGIRGGTAITKHQTLVTTDGGQHARNPATGDDFKITRKKTGLFNRVKGVWVKPYYTEE